MTTPAKLTDGQIVAGLRSQDGKEVLAALNAVFPDSSKSVLLMTEHGACASNGSDLHHLMVMALRFCVAIGRRLGVELIWAPTCPPAGGIITPGDPRFGGQPL